jgi:hypothetical protein
MRENRTYGSEGGEGQTLPDPYRLRERGLPPPTGQPWDFARP